MNEPTESRPGPFLECVPNFSEGSDEKKVQAIVAAMQVEGVRLLDWSMDKDHNRSVVTIAGPAPQVVEAAVRGAGKAAELIDLTRQQGAHPRIGAADVIPFVPLSDCSLMQCAVLARQAGMEIWKRHGIPVYFYEAAAARPDRALLEDVRRGQFEGLRDAVRKEAARRPDVGGPDLHPTAGASAVGARKFLIAYNVYLESNDVAAARAIAREVRASSGGLVGVKAMGVMAHGHAQISMNITDFAATPVSQVFGVVKQLAARYHTRPLYGELIGLIPEAAYERDSEWARQLSEFDPEVKVLERKLQNPMPWPAVK
jgi:glutamate formiminotransferase / 5-formyltetrahydrofolate cyclo-ligase